MYVILTEEKPLVKILKIMCTSKNTVDGISGMSCQGSGPLRDPTETSVWTRAERWPLVTRRGTDILKRKGSYNLFT